MGLTGLASAAVKVLSFASEPVAAVSKWSLRLFWSGTNTLDRAADGRSGDAEQVGEFGLGVGALVVQFEEVFGLFRLQFWLLAPQPAVGLGDLHPFPGAEPD